MHTMSYSSFRSDLASALDKVNDDHQPILITRQNGKPAVVISLEDFQSYQETTYLMASPKNATRLNAAITQAETNKTSNHDLLDDAIDENNS
ncbi:MAG: type II toxin-antitoxin system prevent-host-death family antitoxin [Thiotrichales bacterium]|nr:MAG: type II toxin-antitoxin system prevent-host-death family antitoxin [Thiotrichales bacterium]